MPGKDLPVFGFYALPSVQATKVDSMVKVASCSSFKTRLPVVDVQYVLRHYELVMSQISDHVYEPTYSISIEVVTKRVTVASFRYDVPPGMVIEIFTDQRVEVISISVEDKVFSVCVLEGYMFTVWVE